MLTHSEIKEGEAWAGGEEDKKERVMEEYGLETHTELSVSAG